MSQNRSDETVTVLRRHRVEFLPTWEKSPHPKPPHLGPKPEPCVIETLRRDTPNALPGYRQVYGYRFHWPNKWLDKYHINDPVYHSWFGEMGDRTEEERMRFVEDAARDNFISWPIESWTREP